MREGPTAVFSLFEKREVNHPAEGKKIRVVLIFTNIWTIISVLFHGLLVRHPREWQLLNLGIRAVRLDQLDQKLLNHTHHVFPLHKAHFKVELGEFRLAVTALVLITETLGQLVVALYTRHHEQLLKLLWRLRQNVEVPWMWA